MLHNTIFHQSSDGWSEPHNSDDIDLIQFEERGSVYAIDISLVKEIVEMQSITPYPIQQSGHFGIISLRGQTVPVIQLNQNKSSHDVSKENKRLIVLELEEGHSFCLQVTRAKKITINSNSLQSDIVNIDNFPVKILNANDFHVLTKGLSS